MISLLAIAAGSGWAFVRQANQTYLVRPPYVLGNRFEVPESTVERAVSGYGFQAASGQFVDWSTLVQKLQEGIVKTRKSLRDHIPDNGEAAMSLLPHAPPEILERYIERVDRELIPNGELRASRKILNAILSLEQAKAHPTLSARASRLRDKCYELAEQQLEAEQSRAELATTTEALERHFPKAVARYGSALAEYVTSIQRRKQLLVMGN